VTPSRAKQIEAIKREIARIDLVCAGSLVHRTKVCGKPNCRCARDPAQRHGPYYEWNRWDNGRLRHRSISAEQAGHIVQAQDRYQHLLALLAEWEQLSEEEILGPRGHAGRRSPHA
jgi:hypothetical protein